MNDGTSVLISSLDYLIICFIGFMDVSSRKSGSKIAQEKKDSHPHLGRNPKINNF